MEEEHKNVFTDKGDDMLVDMVEKSPAYLMVVKLVDEEVDKIVESTGQAGNMGACHIFWGEKKRILKEKYGIDWRSPHELNEFIMFD